MNRIFWAIISTLLATPAFAVCTGENLLDGLPRAERAGLDALVARQPFPSGNIWLAENGPSKIYIIGTIHIFAPGMEKLVAKATSLVEQADAAFFEVLAEDEARMQQKIFSDPEIGFIVDGPTMPQLLTRDEWQLLSTEMGKRGVPGYLTAKMRPWQIGLTLGIPTCALSDITAKTGIDFKLRDVAASANIPMFALDDVDDLITLLAGDSMEDQLQDLRIGMTLLEFSTPLFISTITSFVAEQHRFAWEFSKYMVLKNAGGAENLRADFEEMEQNFIVARNLKWMDIILPATRNGTFVVAVGAAHLSGNEGILNLLANGGYTLSAVAH